MKKIVILLFVVLSSFANLVAQEKSTFQIYSDNSFVSWTGRSLNGTHQGYLKVKSGTIDQIGFDIVGGTMEVDMNSLVCTDIEDKESNQSLVNHLKSEDFFDTKKYPISSIKIVGSEDVENNGGKQAVVMLTIKGITKEYRAPYKFKIVDGVLHGKARLIFDRTKFNVNFNSSVMDIAKDKMIDDYVELIIEFQSIAK